MTATLATGPVLQLSALILLFRIPAHSGHSSKKASTSLCSRCGAMHGKSWPVGGGGEGSESYSSREGSSIRGAVFLLGPQWPLVARERQFIQQGSSESRADVLLDSSLFSANA